MVVNTKKAKHHNWGTPQNLFNFLNAKFNFTLDSCASDDNHKCEKYYTEKDDGLSKDWSKEIVFMNPPYGREISKWMKKAYEEYKKGAIVVCLIFTAPDTKWWHNYVMKAKELHFVKGRLSFCGFNSFTKTYTEDSPCMFPSSIVIFDKHSNKYPSLKSVNLIGEEL